MIALRKYLPEEFNEMRREGADSVRIQVSQPGIDPDSEMFTPLFFDRVVAAVRAARTAGLIFIISIQGTNHKAERPCRPICRTMRSGEFGRSSARCSATIAACCKICSTIRG